MKPRKNGRGQRRSPQTPLRTAYQGTDSGPTVPPPDDDPHPALRQARATGQRVAAIPQNLNKPFEYGPEAGRPRRGLFAESPPDNGSLASTLSESSSNPKTGPRARSGENSCGGALPRVRADSGARAMTTNQGVAVADNQSSLKAGLRGPSLLKDFILREKLTHFDHERIPERIVHARGSGAHGYFECITPLPRLTRAAPFASAGKRTPVFVRFSTVAGERGSKDTARDIRGFAVKFYTEEGNWDLVGNNVPVFFIQDAMKFPDLVHAVKPEPHHGMPQAASAHDTFWDFISLMPESIHAVMWAMSDRGIPRSYRMMQGFGVHTFRFVNERGDSRFVKFHWTPVLGTHSHVWDEAVKISGADPDYHRRDLWEAIEAGDFPEWELGIQVFDEKQADRFSFDVLDPTKLVPEELVPVQVVGRMVLNRNPDNFFAETEQVAFCTAHVIPGIDFTNDPLLAGRIHSYVDTQLSRLGGPNFHEIPINAPLAPVHNNQRDGMHRQAIHRGRVAYEPNSLAGGCPFQTGETGFMHFPESVSAVELRGKPEKFAEHYHQATLFYVSQTEAEQRHIAAAFVFELSKVTVPGIRQRVVSLLQNVSSSLASTVAAKLAIDPLPPALPRSESKAKPEVTRSAFLSLTAHPGDGSIRTRRIAILVAPGVEESVTEKLAKPLIRKGAVVRFVGAQLGPVPTDANQAIEADATFTNAPGPLFDAVAVCASAQVADSLCANGPALEFLRDQYRHGKALLAVGEARRVLAAAGILLDRKDPGLVISDNLKRSALASFVEAVAAHRHPERETDPPPV
jgi:catalase